MDKKIRFLEIPELIGAAMDAHQVTENPTVEEILAAERETYRIFRKQVVICCIFWREY